MSDTKNNEVILSVGGIEYSGWKSVRITTGIERLARDFSLEVTRKWPGSDITHRIRPGDLCVVKIGEDTVLTGYIDAVPINYDGSAVTVGVHGRSKTSDLIDCTPYDVAPEGGWQDVDNGRNKPPRPLVQNTNTQWHNTRIEAIIKYLAKPYRVDVFASGDTGAPLRHFSISPFSKIFDVIDELMRKRQVLVTDTGFGELDIINVGDGGRYRTPLALGKNILAGSAELNYKNVFTEYVCKGVRSIDDHEDADQMFSTGYAIDGAPIFGVNRRRRLVFSQSGQMDSGACQDVVEYEKAYRAARALEAHYTVSGWREAEGGLWFPNVFVQVDDPIIGLKREMLITEVSWVLDNKGMRTELKVMPPEGCLTKPEKAAIVPSWKDVKIGEGSK